MLDEPNLLCEVLVVIPLRHGHKTRTMTPPCVTTFPERSLVHERRVQPTVSRHWCGRCTIPHGQLHSLERSPAMSDEHNLQCPASVMIQSDIGAEDVPYLTHSYIPLSTIQHMSVMHNLQCRALVHSIRHCCSGHTMVPHPPEHSLAHE